MQRMDLNFGKFAWANLAKLAAAILLAACFPVLLMAQQKGQKTFSSAEEASKALVTAAQNNDEKAMLDIFGPAGKQSFRRETTPRTRKTALPSSSVIRRCTVW